jgi:hypothetical protein
MSVFSTQVQPYTQAQPYSMSVGCSPATLTAGQSGSCVIHVLGGATGSVDLYVHDQYFGTVRGHFKKGKFTYAKDLWRRF